jgi:hypothetical protein
MEAIEAQFPQVKVFSLPHVGDDKTRRHIDLGVKGDPAQVEPAFEKMQEGLRALHAEHQISN